jgi:hypothetical protein
MCMLNIGMTIGVCCVVVCLSCSHGMLYCCCCHVLHTQALASALASHYGESDDLPISGSRSSSSSSSSSDQGKLLHETLVSVGTVPLGVQQA